MLQAHIYKAKAVKFGMRVRTWDSLPQAKFCKNCLMENLYEKLPILTISEALSPHFKSHNGEISRDTIPEIS